MGAVALDEGRVACSESIDGFLQAVDSFSELELLDASRCHGWTRLDAVVHVMSGWQEMLGGLVSPVDGEPTVDSSTYWTAFAEAYGGEDPVEVLMAQRRRTAAYARPTLACDQLQDVAAAVVRGVDAFGDRRCLWQGQVFAPGDFLTIWAVENVVHHLDLRSTVPAPVAALSLARSTVEAIAGSPLPGTYSDEDATLIGTGRLAVPEGLRALANRLPAFG